MSRSRRDRIDLSQSILSRPPQVASMFSYSVLTNEQSQQLIIMLMAFDILNSKFCLNQYKIFIQTSDISNHMFSKDIHDVYVCYPKLPFYSVCLLPQNFCYHKISFLFSIQMLVLSYVLSLCPISLLMLYFFINCLIFDY